MAQDTVSKLQSTLAQLRDKENSASDQMKRSLDVAEQAQYEKAAADHEIRRLKDEVERQHGKLRDSIAEQVYLTLNSNLALIFHFRNFLVLNIYLDAFEQL